MGAVNGDRSQRLAKTLLQAQAVAAPQPHPRSRSQHDDQVPVRILLQFVDDVEIDDRGAMDANEAARVERVVEIAQQAAMELLAAVAQVQTGDGVYGAPRVNVQATYVLVTSPFPSGRTPMTRGC
jgi:hypothetical protein